MMPKTIADILAGLPSTPTEAELIELGKPSNGAHAPILPWIKPPFAARAKDVRARQESGLGDDRPTFVKAAQSARAMAARRAAGEKVAFNFAKSTEDHAFQPQA
jgi:hypothetical protein